MSVKHDQGKPRPSLILGSMSNAIAAVVDVAEHGARKYQVDGWLGVPDGQQRYTDALLRHLLADVGGEERDPDSGLLHAAHVAWGALARLELMLRGGTRADDLGTYAGKVSIKKPEPLDPSVMGKIYKD